MEDNVIHKLIDKIRNKIQKRKQGYPYKSEYAFSPEEIASLNEQNKQKIQDLKQDLHPKQKNIDKQKETKKEILSTKVNKEKEILLTEVEKQKEQEKLLSEEKKQEEPKEIIPKPIEDSIDEKIPEETAKEEKQELIKESKEIQEDKEENTTKNSFINLSKEHQDLVMIKWNSIDNNEIDKDIIEGKDLLNHNYTITYADASAKYIHTIRKKYEIIICYLIGFNNEKKGIYDKTIFSDKIDNEWKFLSNYIKLLEKIRNFKKQ